MRLLICIFSSLLMVSFQDLGLEKIKNEKEWKEWSNWLPTKMNKVTYRFKRTTEWDFFLNEKPSSIRWDIEVRNQSEFNVSFQLSTYAIDKTFKSSGFVKDDELGGKEVFLNLEQGEVWSGVLQDMSKDDRGPSIQFDLQ